MAFAIPAGAWAQTLGLPDLGLDTTPITGLTDTVSGTVDQLESTLPPLPVDLGPVTGTIDDTVGGLETTLPPLPVDLGTVTDTVNDTVGGLPPLPPLPPVPPLPIDPALPPILGTVDPFTITPGIARMLNSDTPAASALAEMLTMGAVMDNVASSLSPNGNSAFKAAPADSSDWPISDDPSAMVLAALPLLGLVCAFIAISSYLNVARKIRAHPQDIEFGSLDLTGTEDQPRPLEHEPDRPEREAA